MRRKPTHACDAARWTAWRCGVLLVVMLLPLTAFAAPQSAEALARIMAAINTGDHAQGIALGLDASDASPEDGRVWHLLGVAYAASGQYESAGYAFGRADALGYDSPHFRQSYDKVLLVLEARAKQQRAQDQEVPHAVEVLQTPPPREWGYEFSVAAGYNSNVTYRPESASILSAALDDERDAQFNESLLVWARLAGNETRGLIGHANLGFTQFADQTDLHEFTIGGGVDGYWQRDWLRLDIGFSYDYTTIDGRGYASVWTLHAGVQVSETDKTRTRFEYIFSDRSILEPVVPQEDRDGQLHAILLSQAFDFTLRDRPLRLTVGAEFGVEDAEGRSASNDYWGVTAAGEYKLADRLSVACGVAYRETDYAHDHIRTFFTQRRGDESWEYRTQVRYRLRDNVDLSLHWTRIDNDSNLLRFFAYDQDVVMLRLTFRGP